jgi:TonB family protein
MLRTVLVAVALAILSPGLRPRADHPLAGPLPVAIASPPTVKPLPDNKPCPYPPDAQRLFIAGSVAFSMQVRPDGTPESIEVDEVPQTGVGFENTVRDCLSKWRFEPATTGETELRRHQGVIRFRLSGPDEDAIRSLLEALEEAWNKQDAQAVNELMFRAEDSTQVHPALDRPLYEELREGLPGSTWRMQLEPWVHSVRFDTYDLVEVRQGYARVESGDANATRNPGVVDLLVGKGARGWRVVRISILSGKPGAPQSVGGSIREPRKVRDRRPDYPESMKARRIQGRVILECVIAPTGKVSSVRVLRGVHEHLDKAAVDAVKRWEYTPTLLNGAAVPVIMTVTVNFRLQ